VHDVGAEPTELLAYEDPAFTLAFALWLEDRNAEASLGMTTGVDSMSIAYQHVADSEL
jgi:hypothetical protein